MDAGTDAGVDAGQPVDAGTDAGVDSGTIIDPHGLGMKCSTPNQTQANCSRNLDCIGLTNVTDMCSSLGCESAFLPDAGTDTTNPCGTTETGLSNICIPFSTTQPSDSACARGCDPTATNPCFRADMACWTETDSTNTSCTKDSDCMGDFCVDMGTPTAPMKVCSVAFCWTNCNFPGNECGYGEFCVQSGEQAGECSQTTCDSQNPCSSGDVCYTDNTQTPPQSTCVPDCRTANPDGGATCPAGRTCNAQGGCDPIIHTFGEACGQTTASCDSSSICITLASNATVGECLTVCTGDSQCADGATCTLGLQNGMTVCTPPPCGPMDGGTTTADAGSTDAGTADAGVADAGTVDAGVDAGPFMCAAGTACGALAVSQTQQIQVCLPVQP